jgi:hypothetical protein
LARTAPYVNVRKRYVTAKRLHEGTFMTYRLAGAILEEGNPRGEEEHKVIRFDQWLIDRAAAILEAKAMVRMKTGAMAEAARRKSIGTVAHLISKSGRQRYQHQHEAPASKPARILEAAGDRLEVEQVREDHDESLLAVDPYDVLARPSESGFKTSFERDDASNINPQPRP